ncbi:hypothetical protein HYW67_00225 [Candidatus Parcubacteria bacterium]|nr:hypothetical protein [Candidatus Parcubacteria bacterium]
MSSSRIRYAIVGVVLLTVALLIVVGPIRDYVFAGEAGDLLWGALVVFVAVPCLIVGMLFLTRATFGQASDAVGASSPPASALRRPLKPTVPIAIGAIIVVIAAFFLPKEFRGLEYLGYIAGFILLAIGAIEAIWR